MTETLSCQRCALSIFVSSRRPVKIPLLLTLLGVGPESRIPPRESMLMMSRTHDLVSGGQRQRCLGSAESCVGVVAGPRTEFGRMEQ